MKLATPAAIPASIERAKKGLAAISFKIVLPEDTDSYSVSVKDDPIANKIGITTASPIDQPPILVLGLNLQDLSAIPVSF